MAIKPGSLNLGTQVWNYVPRDPATVPGALNFPGLATNRCGAAPGDAIIIKSVRAKAPGGAFAPDTNGFLPHLAVYPGSNDLVDPNKDTAQPGFAWTNDSAPP